MTEEKKKEEIKDEAVATAELKVAETKENIKSEEKKKDVKNEQPMQAKTKQGTIQQSAGGHKKKMIKNKRSDRRRPAQNEFDQSIIDIARVTRVMAGGKRMRFRACVAIGDKKGKVGIGLAKGADVTLAINKAVNKAKKEMIDVQIVNGTIAHAIEQKMGAAKILLRPARKGRGIICGGVVRIIMEVAGIHNVTSKILGTNNKVSNAKCTIAALKNLKQVKIKEDQKNKQKGVEDVKKEDIKKKAK